MPPRLLPQAVCTLMLLLALIASGGLSAQPSITNLGYLGQGRSVTPRDMNADGSVIVGYASDLADNQGFIAFRWTRSGGMSQLTRSPGVDLSAATGVDSAGTRVTVTEYPANIANAQYRVIGGSTTSLNAPNGGWVAAGRLSADGTTVVGSFGFTDSDVPYRWTLSTGIQSLGLLPNALRGNATGVSSDGSIVFGTCAYLNGGGDHGFRWSAADGMTDLGFAAGTVLTSIQSASSDGLTAVGSGLVPNRGTVAVRWTQGAGVESLGRLGSNTIDGAFAANSDGSVIVGESGGRAFLWTSASGMVEVRALLSQSGVDVSGWALTRATAINADGTVISGYGTFNGVGAGWVAVVPAPATVSLVTGCILASLRRRRRHIIA